MNKKIYLVIIIFAIAILAIMITNIQREKIVMVESGDDISRIRINKNTIEDKDTIDDIVEIFKKYDTKKTINPFPMETGEMEIDYVDNNMPRHIVLGETNIIYESVDGPVFEIIDGDNLLLELKKYFNYRLCYAKEFDYVDTFLGGMESFQTYGDLIKNFGLPNKVKQVTDDEIIYGRFSVLIYDDIEFVIQCSRNEENEFFIKDNDRVCRVDITGEKYSLDSPYFGGIGIGSSANDIVQSFDKQILEIDYSQPNTRCIERVVTRCRTDVEKYNYEKGIYFSGRMDNGLALGVVFLIDENDKVARIIMGWPTAG
jgi:hypothetical protein